MGFIISAPNFILEFCCVILISSLFLLLWCLALLNPLFKIYLLLSSVTSCSPSSTPPTPSHDLFPSFDFGIKLNNNLHTQMESIVFLPHPFLDKGWYTKCDLNTNPFPLAPTLGFLVNSDKYIVMKCCPQLRGCFHHSSTKLRLYCQSLVCGKCQVFSFFYFQFILVMSFALVADSRIWPAGIYFGLYLCVFLYIYI